MRSMLLVLLLAITACKSGTPPEATTDEIEATTDEAVEAVADDGDAVVADGDAVVADGEAVIADGEAVVADAMEVDAHPDEHAIDISPDLASPETLYAQCLDRVEQPQEDGECTTDEDCATAGCSQEVCTTKTAATEIMTTCEIKRCFSVLEACGCIEGHCAWTIGAGKSRMRPLLSPPPAK